MSSHTFKVFAKSPDAITPRRAEPGSAGYDLTSVIDIGIPPKSQCIVDTGLIFEFPSDCYARIAPRSGLAAKNSIDVLAGVVDSSYRDTIKVIIFNHSDSVFEIKIGNRIAQLIFERIYIPELEVITDFNEFTPSDRGIGGFGSTGV
jgi:dUTP pyrophosphatase